MDRRNVRLNRSSRARRPNLSGRDINIKRRKLKLSGRKPTVRHKTSVVTPNLMDTTVAPPVHTAASTVVPPVVSEATLAPEKVAPEINTTPVPFVDVEPVKPKTNNQTTRQIKAKPNSPRGKYLNTIQPNLKSKIHQPGLDVGLGLQTEEAELTSGSPRGVNNEKRPRLELSGDSRVWVEPPAVEHTSLNDLQEQLDDTLAGDGDDTHIDGDVAIMSNGGGRSPSLDDMQDSVQGDFEDGGDVRSGESKSKLKKKFLFWR